MCLDMSRYSLLDPIISSQARSDLRQSILRFGRGLDPANSHFANFAAPLVLVGAARGGTTLLANLVGAHPRVTIYHERFTIGKDSYRDTFEATHGTDDLARAFICYLPHALKQANARWGIKICTYHWARDDYDRFLHTFPRAQIIFVVRDGRDVVLSMLKRSQLFKTPEQCATRWLESVEVFEYLRDRAPQQLLWFRYEELVADPARQVQAICQFIGEEFHPEMLDPKTWPRVGSYEIAPVTSDKVGKWRQQPRPELPPALAQRFDTALARLGYETFLSTVSK